MLGQRLRRWPNIEPTLNKCTMFERKSACPANTRHLYNIYTKSAQRLRRWSNIALSHTNDLCLLGMSIQAWVKQFQHPSSNTVSLFASKRPSRGKGQDL